MICPTCQTPLPDDARFCCACGGSVTAFDPPDGFEIDPESLLYYRDDGMSDDGTEHYHTWFDPDAGTYEQGSSPVEQPRPEPEFLFEPTEETNPELPEGFTLDPDSGLYYLATPGRDPDTGAAGEWYSWYYPDSGEYEQVFYPSDPAPGDSQSPDAQPPRDADERPRRHTSSKRKVAPLLIVLPLIALLAGGAFAFARLGGPDWLAGFMASEPPEEVVTETPPAEDPPAVTPTDEEPPERDEEDAPDKEDDREPNGMNWENPQTAEADGVVMTMPSTFRYDEGIVVQVDGITAEMVRDGAQLMLGAHEHGVFVAAVDLGEGSDIYGLGEWDAGEYSLYIYGSREFDSRDFIVKLPFTVTGDSGESEASADAEASPANWAAIYQNFLEEQIFSFQKFQFYGEPCVLPVYTPVDVTLALAAVSFYEVSGFDCPVMLLSQFVESDSEPGTLSPDHLEALVTVRDGQAAWITSQSEIDMVLRYSPGASRQFEILGEAVTDMFDLVVYSASEDAPLLAGDKYLLLYNWLDEQASFSPASEAPREAAPEMSEERRTLMEELGIDPSLEISEEQWAEILEAAGIEPAH